MRDTGMLQLSETFRRIAFIDPRTGEAFWTEHERETEVGTYPWGMVSVDIDAWGPESPEKILALFEAVSRTGFSCRDEYRPRDMAKVDPEFYARLQSWKREVCAAKMELGQPCTSSTEEAPVDARLKAALEDLRRGNPCGLEGSSDWSLRSVCYLDDVKPQLKLEINGWCGRSRNTAEAGTRLKYSIKYKVQLDDAFWDGPPARAGPGRGE